MTELSAAEQQVLRDYRAKMRRKHLEWIKELEAHGYSVTQPTSTTEQQEVSLTPNQADLLRAVRNCKNPQEGATAAELRAYVLQATGRNLPRGTTGTALLALQAHQLIERMNGSTGSWYRAL